MQDAQLFQMLFSVLVLVFSVVAHEVSHGYMAQSLGDPTARLAGRLTLNPLRHIDPIGSLLVPFITSILPGGIVFGWAKPVPYNPYNLRDQKWGDAKVALAGPLTNLGIAVIFAAMLRFGEGAVAPEAANIMQMIVLINVILTVFNLWEYYQKHLKDELKDVHIIAVHTHGPGLLHVKGNGVRKLEDMKGLKLRGPSRQVNKLLETLGATPVGMPVPAMPDALSKGVIDGTVVPWEGTLPLRVATSEEH